VACKAFVHDSRSFLLPSILDLQARRKFVTDDVVKDIPLPEFRIDFTTIARIFAERRPLKPKKRVSVKVNPISGWGFIKFPANLQDKGRNEGLPYVPEDLELLVTVRRCSNLPMRAKNSTLSLPAAKRGECGLLC